MKLSLRLFAQRQREAVKHPISQFIWTGLLAVLLGGCGAPGEPVPPSPPIPTAITDLTAQQTGDAATLYFTMPGKSVSGDKLKEVPSMEVLRGSLATDGTVDRNSFQVVEKVPGAMIGAYTLKGKTHFIVPIAAGEIQKHPGESAIFRVRARASDKKTSANSNDATLKLFPVAAAIDSLRASLTEQGIELTWSAPARTSSGEPIQGIEEYRVYRGELDPASAAAVEKDLTHAVWKTPLAQIATAKAPEYRDSGFDYGKTYAYVVRTVRSGESAGVESGDSREVILTPKDTFPPNPPQGVVVAVLPGTSAGKFVVDLSWSINVEPDLAGYRIYRSEQQGVRGSSTATELVPTPAYRDEAVETGRHYWYTVMAVDRAGNESGPSEQIAVDISPRSQ